MTRWSSNRWRQSPVVVSDQWITFNPRVSTSSTAPRPDLLSHGQSNKFLHHNSPMLLAKKKWDFWATFTTSDSENCRSVHLLRDHFAINHVLSAAGWGWWFTAAAAEEVTLAMWLTVARHGEKKRPLICSRKQCNTIVLSRTGGSLVASSTKGRRVLINEENEIKLSRPRQSHNSLLFFGCCCGCLKVNPHYYCIQGSPPSNGQLWFIHHRVVNGLFFPRI